MKNILKFIVLFVISTILFSSCKIHTQHYMFQTDESILKQDSSLFEFSEDNYILQINDWLQMDVYTNNGELLVDPNKDLQRSLGGGVQNSQVSTVGQKQQYLVLESGEVRFPMIGNIKVDKRSIIDVENELQKLYAEFYIEPYVRIKPLNKRVVLFSGKGGQVIPLANENMNLLEILALGGEISTGSNAKNVKIIRGNLKNPEVLKIDLSTVEGLQQYNLKIQPNDIIYVQAKRNVVTEVLKDIAPIISLTSSILFIVWTFSRI